MKKAIVTARPGEQTLVIERDFDAPRAKVFKAMTTKELVEKWWIGPGYGCRVEVLEPRTGGCWKYVQTGADGQEFSFHGSFHTVTQEMVVQTFEFDGLPEAGHVALEKMILTEAHGRTRLRIESTFMSVADRDGMIQSGMEDGMQNTYDRLDQVLETLP